MGDSGIEWLRDPVTDKKGKSWNPVTGCEKKSAGCRECYAKILHDQRHKAYLHGKKLPEQYSTPFEEVRCHPNRLDIPLHWKKPAKIFVNSMSDLFHEDVPFSFILKVYNTILEADWHTFIILTKRIERVPRFYDWLIVENIYQPVELPKNLWLGVSVEDQKTADERIPLLLQTPAVIRFISAEPLLGPINLEKIKTYQSATTQTTLDVLGGIKITKDIGIGVTNGQPKLDWVICGGESGKNARPMHPDWARSLRDQCKTAGVPFFFKQWGRLIHLSQIMDLLPDRMIKYWEDKYYGDGFYDVGKKKAGRLLDGIEYNEYPTVGGK